MRPVYQSRASTWIPYAFRPSLYSTGAVIRRSVSTKSLDFKAIDAKWQPRWREHTQWTCDDAPKGKYFVMPMFPYPSGALHIGHLRNYTISDVIARYRRMRGYQVLHPIGWDAFGLPAENAAIQRGVNPAAWTLDNISKMKQQIEAMGGCWDWDKELRTCDPSYYKQTQQLFLQLYKHGLAYQDEALVNYDPVDKTVLANEQVDANGFSWRSGAKVQQLKLKQWFVRITDYAQELHDDLTLLSQDDNWPQRVVAMQKNWLGRSEGASLRFLLHGQGITDETVQVFTTRPDTLFGVQYIALSHDHDIVRTEAKSNADLQHFLNHPHDADPNTKAGFLLPGVTASNPLSRLFPEDSRLRHLPVFAAPYVRSDYASGAVMGVPAHDTRDFAFWQHNRSPHHRPPRQVVLEHDVTSTSQGTLAAAVTVRGRLSDDCFKYAGLESTEAARLMVDDLRRLDQSLASNTVSWRMRDWLVSRQRYWGTPIPMIHCASCGAVPVPDEDLPVELPLLSDDEWKGLRGNPLESNAEWLKADCPKCGAPSRRETDTMDTFVDSSWYYLGFARAAEKEVMPVDLYIGGVEHAILHLLYARFISKFLAKIENKPELREPFHRLLTQGMVHGKTYSDPDTGRALKPDEVDLSDATQARVKSTGKTAEVSFEKMSKSKHNGVDPQQCMERYGADTTRAHLLFQAPVGDVLDWDEGKISGIQRWFGRLWGQAHELGELSQRSSLFENAPPSVSADIQDKITELWRQTQHTIASVNESFGETHALNTVVSDLMSLTNTIQQCASNAGSLSAPEQRLLIESFGIVLRLLTPIAPSFAEECWAVLRNTSDSEFSAAATASRSGFPQQDGSLARLQTRTQPCAVQVNGKLRFVAQIPTPDEGLSGDALKDWVLSRVLESAEGSDALLRSRISPSTAKKIIAVRGGRTLNIVT